MLVSEMQLLRVLCSPKHHLLRLRPRSSPLCSLSRNPFSPHSVTPRLIHSTSSRRAPDWSIQGAGTRHDSSGETRTDRDPDGTGVVTVYDPVSGQLVTRRGGIREPESPQLPESTPSFGHAGKSNSFGGFGDVARGSRKKGKSKTYWVCENCGHSEGQWWGTCQSCSMVGTLKPFSTEETAGGGGGGKSGFEVSESKFRSWHPQQSAEVKPVRLRDVNMGIDQLEWRIPLPGLFGNEVARVLGGGIVPGSLILLGGDPGVGKSTLLLQLAAMVAEGRALGTPAPVLYVSGEESVDQIGNRADRMGIETEELFLYSCTDIEDILEKIELISPRALIVDSIQTVYLKGVSGSAGGLTQVKECTSALLRFAKKKNIPVLLIGHVTKSGEIAGPRVLEHIVDVVLYLEGEKHTSHRLLRSVKNRYGSTDELGVFEMTQSGLQVVSNPSEIFLSQQQPDSEVLAGLAVAVIMDASRSFLIEIQALCLSGSAVSRHTNGIQASRADMIIAVLMKQAGLKLQDNAIFLNVVSGAELSETAGDLAVAAAICSSFLEFPIPNHVAFIGEVGLGGEVRMVPSIDKRVTTLAKLGYKKCIVPKLAEKHLACEDFGNMTVLGCGNMKEVINTVFTTE